MRNPADPARPPGPSGSEPARGSSPSGLRWIDRGPALLRIPLFHKIVVANTVLVSAAAVAGALLAPSLSAPGALTVFLGGLVLVVTLNGFLVHLALLPLREIEEAARSIENGEADVRIRVSPLADRRLSTLARNLDRMVRSLAMARERQRDLSARIVDAEELERKRIAHELFDETAQLLSSVLLRLQIATRALPEIPCDDSPPNDPGVCGVSRCRSALGGARDDARSALEGIQRIARGLRPPELDELGISKALEAQLRQHARAIGIDVELVEDEPVDPFLTPAQALAAYRIIQEGFSNALRHGRPDRIRIRLGRDGDRVTAELDDDGSGFDATAALADPARNVGLLRMQERARFVGADLVVDSMPGEGTHLRLSLPPSGP